MIRAVALGALLLAGCGPAHVMTPAERQDAIDYYHSVCDFNPQDAFEEQLCATPMGAAEKGQKLRLHRQQKGTP